MSARPPVPTSAVVQPLDLAHTENARHVYIKKEDPSGLAARFEGPYPIVSRPSRSTIKVRVGSFADGSPRVLDYNWNSCKIAHLREDAVEAERPKLGRPAQVKSLPQNDRTSAPSEVPNSTDAGAETGGGTEVNKDALPVDVERAKIQTRFNNKPDIITKEMFDKWTPELLNIKSTRPIRSTRNPAPIYS